MHKVADKLATPHNDVVVDSHNAGHATNFTDRRLDSSITTAPIVTDVHSSRQLETGVAGMKIDEHHHKHDHHDHHHDKHIDTVNVTRVELPTTVDHKTIVADTVVEETLRKDLLVQVQPVIHKEVEREEVHHIVKHINEAPAPSVAGSVTLAPVVQEHVHTHVIDEIHPVIHREIVVQEVERVEKHVTEHVVVPTRHVHEVVTETVVAPVHVHTAACRHDVPVERLNNVILPGTTGLPSSHVDVVRSDVIVDRTVPVVAAPIVPVVGTHTVNRNTTVTEVVLKPGEEVILEKNNLTGNTVVVEKRHHGHVVPTGEHIVSEHGSHHHTGTHVTAPVGTHVETTHIARGLDTTGLDRPHGHHTTTTHAHDSHATHATHDSHHTTHDEKHHHHLHLPHFLGGHKKEDHVEVKHGDTKHTVDVHHDKHGVEVHHEAKAKHAL